MSGSERPQPPTSFIAFIVLCIPSMAITRLKLYASTCRLISVLTMSMRRVRKLRDCSHGHTHYEEFRLWPSSARYDGTKRHWLELRGSGRQGGQEISC